MSDAILEKVRLSEQLALEKAKLFENMERLREALSKKNSDWLRLRDFIIAESPTEYLRLTDAGKGSQGVEVLLKYLSSLYSENAKLRQALAR